MIVHLIEYILYSAVVYMILMGSKGRLSNFTDLALPSGIPDRRGNHQAGRSRFNFEVYAIFTTILTVYKGSIRTNKPSCTVKNPLFIYLKVWSLEQFWCRHHSRSNRTATFRRTVHKEEEGTKLVNKGKQTGLFGRSQEEVHCSCRSCRVAIRGNFICTRTHENLDYNYYSSPTLSSFQTLTIINQQHSMALIKP